MPDTGSLKQFGIAELLSNIEQYRLSGLLTLETGSIKKSIFAEKGEIVFASSNQDEDLLGEKLVRGKKITREQRDESLSRSKEIKKPLGLTLLDMGYLLPKELFLELRNQIAEIIFSVFLWEDGKFTFDENKQFENLVKLKMKTSAVISEGIIRNKSRMAENVLFVLHEAEDIMAKIDQYSHYELLGVRPDADEAEIKKGYLKKMQTYHPDKYKYLSDSSLEDKLTKFISYINRAYQTLSDTARKSSYDSTVVKKPERSKKESDASRIEEQFLRGVAEIKGGNFWNAVEHLRWATNVSPKNPKYWSFLSLALSKIPQKGKEAEESIMKAIEIDPNNANYYVHLGIIYAQADLKKRAITQFQKALELDPTNSRAQKEMRNIKA